jgi:uncharacterized Tic20 family protein
MDIRPHQLPPTQSPAQPSQSVNGGGQKGDGSADRALSALAHGAIAFGIFGISLPISLVISGILWLYSKRSPMVRFHSEQAGCYQCSVLIINVVLFIVLLLGGGFSLFTVFQGKSDWGLSWGVLLGIVILALWYVGSIIYGIVAAIMVLMGKPFKYLIIGDRFERKA